MSIDTVLRQLEFNGKRYGICRRLCVGDTQAVAFYLEVADQETLKDIFELASWAPSNCNVQPWHVHVVSGEACNRMREKMKAAALVSTGRQSRFPLAGQVYR